MIAVGQGYENIVDLLIHAQANVNQQDKVSRLRPLTKDSYVATRMIP